jgi:hypothetical protein
MTPPPSSRTRTKPSERRSRFSTPVDEDALEFIQRVRAWMDAKGRRFPSWTEVLVIVRSLGYRKVEAPGPLPLDTPTAED